MLYPGVIIRSYFLDIIGLFTLQAVRRYHGTH